ncbi:gliding motility-associated ABC transporter permease subunit GldF [Ancylomarina salipaludis]|uniref:Gliding motility-associated ABC transporter permease subunit GldF n=1 Tax=Ancylomarina salipaludis TaxID=2501299 RepID=A0A4Q1JPT8_9BACT|nr:gliding motility-associated ABC transporter permease subunit GldF [Ancylomarina salipaludis]RXQ97326.1 gliding motility-associated ABC transporter permease subunit GldF [Ancylomarina salipaludis]
MFTLLLKEFRSFFSSISGYLIISIFLLATGLFIWVFPGNTNVLDGGYANLDTLFDMAPWIYLFLIPALCMRLFTDERKSGTIELLFTRPISDFKIVLSKFFAALLLVIFSLLFCLIYYLSVYYLGKPVGSIDVGAFWGSFLGLFFLAIGYVSLAVFAGSLTDNQIIAFLLSLVLCFSFYMGFDYLSDLMIFQSLQTEVINLGINEHYRSLSRGVVDSRDVSYFICLSLTFLFATRTVLQSRKW